MEEAVTHYSALEEEYQEQNFDDDSDDDLTDVLDSPKGRIKISAERIIENDEDSIMKLLTNFSIDEFNELFTIVQTVLTKGVHKDTIITPRTRFLLALCYCKFNEKWKILGYYFGIDPSYTQKITLTVIEKTSKIFANEFIRWISVIDRITDFEMYNPDWPTLLGSLDATVQLIARSHIYKVQENYYSGKHKMHCIKAQALVSPTGFLIYTSAPVPGRVHDFQLYKDSDLEEKIMKENEKCQLILNHVAITLADAGYQGISSRLPGAVTPYKRFRGNDLTEDQIAFNQKVSKSRIIVENWFGRNKQLWAIMGTKFRLKISKYEDFWIFCSSLTNFHIKIYPLRNPANSQIPKDSSDDEENLGADEEDE